MFAGVFGEIRAEIIPKGPDPDNAGVGTRISLTLEPVFHVPLA